MPSLVPDQWPLTVEAVADIHNRCARPGNAAVEALQLGRQRTQEDLNGFKQILARAEHDAAMAKRSIRNCESEIAQIDCALAVLDARVG